MKTFLKPKNRSRVRLFLGTIYYRMRRWLQWYFSSTKYAFEKNNELKMQNIVSHHQTPLIRNLPQSEMYLQRNKVVNLRLAISKIDGLILRPGEVFSFWRLIGKPTKCKGYLDGMVLFDGTVRPGIGGGLCQLSNLIYWMTLHTPLTVVERWRHSYDVFPDADRTQPFGSGATVSYNHIDLQIKNDTKQEYLLRLQISDDSLIGRWFSNEPLLYTYEVYEKFHEITHEIWGGYVRHNVINRRVFDEEGNEIVDEVIAENHAIMMYQPYLSGAAGHNIA